MTPGQSTVARYPPKSDSQSIGSPALFRCAASRHRVTRASGEEVDHVLAQCEAEPLQLALERQRAGSSQAGPDDLQ
jgi:hypothetical protein